MEVLTTEEVDFLKSSLSDVSYDNLIHHMNKARKIWDRLNSSYQSGGAISPRSEIKSDFRDDMRVMFKVSDALSALASVASPDDWKIEVETILEMLPEHQA